MKYIVDNSKLVELKSVGAWLDEDTITVYPTTSIPHINLDEGVSLIEDGLNQEWWDTLSKKDKDVIDKAQLKKLDMIGFEGTIDSLSGLTIKGVTKKC